MKRVCPQYVPRTPHSLQKISLVLMIDANERVAHHHGRALRHFSSSDCLMPRSSWPIAAALVVVQVGRKFGGRVHFGSERERGKGPTGCHFGGSNHPRRTTPQTVQARAEATQAIESAF